MFGTRIDRRPGGSLVALGVALAAASSAPVAHAAADRTTDVAEDEAAPRGVELGSFFFRDVRGTEGSKTRLSFSLYAAVDAEQESAFRKVLRAHENRVRNQVIVAIRLTETRDLNEPDLNHLKRRMLLRLRRTLPELEIQKLHFREFTLMTE